MLPEQPKRERQHRRVVDRASSPQELLVLARQAPEWLGSDHLVDGEPKASDVGHPSRDRTVVHGDALSAGCLQQQGASIAIAVDGRRIDPEAQLLGPLADDAEPERMEGHHVHR